MDIKVIEKARNTAIEMLEDRGFHVPLEQHNISRENLTIMLDNNNINIYVSKSTIAAIPEQIKEAEPNIEAEIEDEAEVVEHTQNEAQDAIEAEAETEDETEDETEVETEAETEAETEVETEVELDTTATAQKGGAHSKDAYVYFHVAAGKFDKKRLVTTVAKIKETYESNDINIIIIVKEITAPVLKEVDRETYHNVEVFFYKELQSNKSKSRLAPYHQLMTDDEVFKKAEEYGATPHQFYHACPKIYTKDPMARYYGLRDGDMCRIYRQSKSNGQTFAYRAVQRPVIS